MITFARVPIIPGPILEIIVAAKLPEFHPAIANTFHAVPDGTPEGYIYDGTNCAAPVIPSIPLITQARIALDESDITMLRCVENLVQVPPAWATYRAALRAITNDTSQATEMPTRPPYPQGT